MDVVLVEEMDRTSSVWFSSSTPTPPASTPTTEVKTFVGVCRRSWRHSCVCCADEEDNEEDEAEDEDEEVSTTIAEETETSAPITILIMVFA